MTGDEMEKAIEFLLSCQAKTESEIQDLKNVTNMLAEQAASDRQMIRESFTEIKIDISRLVDTVESDRETIREAFAEFRIDISRLVDTVESDRETVRTAISALSGAVTEDRKLLREVARLATASEERLTRLEPRVDKIENQSSEY